MCLSGGDAKFPAEGGGMTTRKPGDLVWQEGSAETEQTNGSPGFFHTVTAAEAASEAENAAAIQAGTPEGQRQARVTEGQAAIDRQFAGFDEAFFAKTRDAYKAYATPQLDRQVAAARDQLEFGLARAGLGRSTVAGRQRGDLDFDIGTQRQGIADRAEESANAQRGNVATARQSIVGQLNADANAGAAASNAAARATVLSQQPAFSPIGELFDSVGRSLSLAAQGEGLVPAGGSSVTGSGAGSPRLFQRLPR